MEDLKYKGFVGSIEYDKETQTMYGKVKFIKGLITYQSLDGTMPSLESEFQDSVDEYLQDCEEAGLKPLISANGVTQVRLGQDLHYRANVKANGEGIKLNELIKKAVDSYVDGNGIHIHQTEHKHTHTYAAQVDNTSVLKMSAAAIFDAKEKAKCH